MKELVKKILKGNVVGKLMYEPLHRVYRLYSVPHRRKMLQKHGPEVLRKLAEVFKRRDVPGFLAAGTLLGFTRENRFMNHDDDIDVGVLPGNWDPVSLLRMFVEEEGFKYVFGFKFRGKTVEFKLSYLGVPIDVFCYERHGEDMFCTCFYYFPEINYPAENANSVWRIHEYNITELKLRDACGVEFPVPSEPEKVMARLYGEDWEIPNPNWDDSMHPGREVMEGEYGYSVSYAEAIQI